MAESQPAHTDSDKQRAALGDCEYCLQMRGDADPSAPPSARNPGMFLMEVPQAVLDAVLAGGEDALEMRGADDKAPAVLAVKGMPGTTYDLKACETSNTLLVGAHPDQPDQPILVHPFSEVVELVPSSLSKAKAK